MRNMISMCIDTISTFYNNMVALCNVSIYRNGDPNDIVAVKLGAPVSGRDRFVGFFSSNGGTGRIDYITPSVHFNTDTDFDLEFDFKFNPTITDVQYLFWAFNTNNDRLYISRNGASSVDGKIRFQAALAKDITIPNMFDGNIHAIAMCVIGNTMFYVMDSVQSINYDITGCTTNGFNNTTWGATSGSATINAWLWNVKVKVAGVVLYNWAIGEGSGSIANDSSGNNNHGTITDGIPVSFWDYHISYGKEWIEPFVLDVPKTGNIINDQAETIGVRNTTDPGDFTPNGALDPEWFWVEDIYCPPL